MAEITASMVKELRDRTGLGMMDCKKALTEAGGDIEGSAAPHLCGPEPRLVHLGGDGLHVRGAHPGGNQALMGVP